MSKMRLELKEAARDVTCENVGRIAVHLEYLCRHDEIFGKWKGLHNLATWIAWAQVRGNAKEHLLDHINVMLTELKRRENLRRSRTI